MKYSLKIYKDGKMEEVGTDFVSTNSFIKCLEAFKTIEGCNDATLVIDTLVDVVDLIFPTVTKEEIKNGVDVEELIKVVNSIVAKLANIAQSKNV